MISWLSNNTRVVSSEAEGEENNTDGRGESRGGVRRAKLVDRVNGSD